MGYTVKWLEDNLGITRKVLRLYEKVGLLPKNKDKKTREFSEEEIDRIWMYRTFQGMGFTMQETFDFLSNENSDFRTAISQKVEELEIAVEEKQKHLDYAKFIKLTGRFPIRPKSNVPVKHSEFQKKVVDKWNAESMGMSSDFPNYISQSLSYGPKEYSEDEILSFLSQIIDLSGVNGPFPKAMATQHVIIEEITKRTNLHYSHPEIQVLVKILYDNMAAIVNDTEFTPRSFARFSSSSFYSFGDISRMQEHQYGEDQCKYLADAIAFFGGFENADDPSLT